MPMRTIETHQNCFCYRTDMSAAIIDLNEFDQATSGVRDVYSNEIFFVLSGNIRITTGLRSVSTLLNGDFVFLPVGTTVGYDVPDRAVTLSIRVHEDVPECHVFQINRRVERIESRPDFFYVMKANEKMQEFLTSFLGVYYDGVRCAKYLQMEVSRMIYLIHLYYKPEECWKFFSQIISADTKFSEYVHANWMKYSTVKGFAEGICMTTHQFSNKFKQIFGMPPYEWMTHKKASKIYWDICRCDMPLKQIAIKHDFSSQANFFHFCKSHFGNTPGEIRRSLKEHVDEIPVTV